MGCEGWGVEIVTTKRLAVKAFDLWSHPPHLAIPSCEFAIVETPPPPSTSPNDPIVLAAIHLLTFSAAPILHSVISVEEFKIKNTYFIDLSNSC
ncbi:hypothetical protein CEXT_475221 [Caerostris extrusa]|uniref:Uncharacterized protein n=1 Tax=Caerostris extrusa TaxID=172846 RepID=A0AAV4SR29_CAEEX|nr:hypothetical protein CEXT_475221 [Caerostris extrusa]